MSDVQDANSATGSGGGPQGGEGTLGAAREEAAHLTHTAGAQARDVVETAKDEASSVVGEVRVQAKDLFEQTRQELADQADTQQQRLARGLSSVGGELDSMAASSAGGGVAADVVGQVARRISGAGSWLEARDPAAVVDELKRYARRKPGMFILGAVVAGVAVGRLTRALTAGGTSGSSGSAGVHPPSTTAADRLATGVDAHDDTPIFDRSSGLVGGAENERPDSF